MYKNMINTNCLKNLGIVLFLLIQGYALSAQSNDVEFRAAWVATVYNIDWPDVKNDPEQQQKELLAILDSAKQANMNAILLQIRPNADALYASSIEPWSEWLTGTRGQDPGYDPLAFAIEKGHEMGIEVHGWVNPYRFETESGRYSGKAGDYKESHPDWILDVDGKSYFNPGLPEVAQYIKNIIGDIVSNYDIDGICFDDYFYPSGISDEDDAAFNAHGLENESRGDFRRRSVNQMIAGVYDTIKIQKPWLRFGVSPAGIYTIDPSVASKYNTTLPSGIVGRDNYHAIYCDPLAWIQMGIVDYISPQLYWQIGGGQDYHKLLEWWSKEADKNNVQCYPSLATYRLSVHQPVVDASDGWALSELINQIDYTRTQRDHGANGIIFYKQSDIEKVENLSNALQSDPYMDFALWPEFSTSDIPLVGTNGRLEKMSQNPIAGFVWDGQSNNKYLVQGFDAENEVTFQQVSYLDRLILPKDTTTVRSNVYTLNRYGKINDVSLAIDVSPVGDVDIERLEGQIIASTDELKWSYVENASVYTMEVAQDSLFEQMVFQTDLLRDTFLNISDLVLVGNSSYYWRVSACNGLGCNTSTTDDFKTGFPEAVSIVSPMTGDNHISLMANISWTSVDGAQSYILQLSKDSLFNNVEWQEEVFDKTETSTAILGKWQKYFLRILAVNSFGQGPWSETVDFRTTTDIPDHPLVIHPDNNSQIEAPTVDIQWDKTDYATGYHVVLALDSGFTNLILDTVVSQYSRQLTVDVEDDKDYYFRVCATYIGGCGNWSEIIHFSRTLTGLYPSQPLTFSVFPNPASEKVFLRFPKSLSVDRNQGQIYMYNVLGQQINIQPRFSSLAEISVNIVDLNSGMYFVKMINAEGRVVAIARFVKE
ncbi:hypothetical protein GCM10025777_22040 [Membranihabitans marinus]